MLIANSPDFSGIVEHIQTRMMMGETAKGDSYDDSVKVLHYTGIGTIVCTK